MPKRARIAQAASKVVGRGVAGRKRSKTPTLAKLKKEAWNALSKYVRYSARLSPDSQTIECYTCLQYGYIKEMQAGHAIPGRTGAVLLDEEIVRPQCERCNIWLRGQYHIFVPKLIREKAIRTGGDPLIALMEANKWWDQKLISAKQVRKYTKEELEAIRDSYREKLKELG